MTRFYYITSIRTEVDGTKLRIGLCEAKDPDDACYSYAKFWRTIVRVVKLEEAVWSEEQQRWVIKRTGRFPKNWCNDVEVDDN